MHCLTSSWELRAYSYLRCVIQCLLPLAAPLTPLLPSVKVRRACGGRACAWTETLKIGQGGQRSTDKSYKVVCVSVQKEPSSLREAELQRL